MRIKRQRQLELSPEARAMLDAPTHQQSITPPMWELIQRELGVARNEYDGRGWIFVRGIAKR